MSTDNVKLADFWLDRLEQHPDGTITLTFIGHHTEKDAYREVAFSHCSNYDLTAITDVIWQNVRHRVAS